MNANNILKNAAHTSGTEDDQITATTTPDLLSMKSASSGERANASRPHANARRTPEMEVFQDILDELSPHEPEKIQREIRAIKASRKRLLTLIKQGVTQDALFAAVKAKGFTLSEDEFGKVVRSLTHPRPRVSRKKQAHVADK